jgi:hypothetical protein
VTARFGCLSPDSQRICLTVMSRSGLTGS